MTAAPLEVRLERPPPIDTAAGDEPSRLSDRVLHAFMASFVRNIATTNRGFGKPPDDVRELTLLRARFPPHDACLVGSDVDAD